jgi:hypothetical protein
LYSSCNIENNNVGEQVADDDYDAVGVGDDVATFSIDILKYIKKILPYVGTSLSWFIKRLELVHKRQVAL